MSDEVSVRNAVDSLIDSLHQWLTQLVWYPGCLVTSVADADDGYIVCQISGGTNQQCGWKKLFSIAVGDYVDVLYDPRSMRWEVFKPGGSVIWSTSNWNLGSDCLRAEYTNNATGTLSLGEVVVFDSTKDNSVTTTTSSGDIDVAGVVLVGGASGSLVQVAVLGRAPVYVDGNVTRGQFLKTSAARGFATPTATFDQGVFGVALTANAAGSSGTVDAFLVGHCWEGAGGGGGGAPTDAQYVTLAADATLTQERILTQGTGISIADGGAGGNVTVTLGDHAHTAAAGQGGQLDWDNIWSDAVHDHSSAAEGGDEIIPNRIGLGTSVADQDGTLALSEATAPTNAANEGRLYAKDVSADTELFYMDDDGNEAQLTQYGSVRFYSYRLCSGAMHWDYSAVDNIATGVITNGSEDVTEVMWANSIATENTGAGKEQHQCWLEPGESYNIYDDGVDTVALSVNADGSVWVQRTAGADTFKVALWLMWV